MRQSSKATCTGLNVLIGLIPMNDAEQADKSDQATLGAYSLRIKDRRAFEDWVAKENKSKFDLASSDPNHNAYYVASKLPPYLYASFYRFCKTNGWSKSTAIKFAIHQLLSSKQQVK